MAELTKNVHGCDTWPNRDRGVGGVAMIPKGMTRVLVGPISTGDMDNGITILGSYPFIQYYQIVSDVSLLKFECVVTTRQFI